MGDIIGGIGSLFGGNSAANDEKKAAQDALTGYNYLSKNQLINSAQSNAQPAMAQQNAQLGAQAGTIGNINQLLTSNGADSPAFKNYLNSTGYNFQLQQGTNAITGSAATKGLLGSGATAKALQGYGQNLASQSFNNYLGQLGQVAGMQGANAAGYGSVVNQGLGAAEAVGQAGTTGGGNAGNFMSQAGQSIGTSEAQAGNLFGGALSFFM